MTHYYNLVLNKLSQIDSVDLTLVIPRKVSKHIGDGVYQTRNGISFRVVELHECSLLGIFPSFRGLAGLLYREKPQIVVIDTAYLYTFILNFPAMFVRNRFNVKLILKSIPFRTPVYREAIRDNLKGPKYIEWLPRVVNKVIDAIGLLRALRNIALRLAKYAYNIPDAHVNYIDDACRIYGSYGVPRENIFITRNSPDTDMLFAVRNDLIPIAPILPSNRHRLIHVGRLVAWKRVDLLLRAFARIIQQFEDAELLVIGAGPEESKLIALSRELSIDHAVRFLGGIYEPRLLGQYYLSSSIYVLAGMGGLSINEAMCYGLPVVCSVCDGTEKFLVREGINGMFFQEGSEADLVRTIAHLFQNPGLRATMGANSTRIIQHEVNIHTVIEGYSRSFQHVCPQNGMQKRRELGEAS